MAPIGNLFSELEDGPVETLRQPSPQALHHFTQADQLQYKRVNGPYKLIMFSGGETRLPYGNLPRLLLAWVSTEAVKTQSPVLVLGNSLAEFMRKLGMKDDSGSPRGDRTRLRNQMDRLFSATLQFIYEDRGPDDSTQVKGTFTSPVARKTHLVWNPKRPNEPVLWESKIELGWDFFHEIIRRPVPLDMNTLTALKRSSLELDLYLWVGRPIAPSDHRQLAGIVKLTHHKLRQPQDIVSKTTSEYSIWWLGPSATS